jgi:hypothetical protein
MCGEAELGRKLFLSGMAVFVFLIAVFVVSVDADSLMWIQTYGGTGTDFGYALVETTDGGYAIAGSTKSFGAGEPNEWGEIPANMWLIKTDEFGNVKWNQTYGGLGSEGASSLVVTSDGGYAIAGDGLLVKTDEFGSMEWNQTFDGYAYSLVETSDGGYALGGFMVPDAWEFAFWLVKTDANGNMLWNQTYGGEHRERAWSMIATSDGGYAMAGCTGPMVNEDFWLVKTDEFGDMEWNRTYVGPYDDVARSLIETSDGGYAIAGETVSDGSEYSDFWLIKTDEFGNVEWNRTYVGPEYDAATSLIETSDGGYAIAGETVSHDTGSTDFWLVKTDAYGNMEWNQAYGGQDVDWSMSLIETSDGGYAMVGGTYSFGVGSGDFLLIKTDELGVIPESTSWLLPTLLLVATFVIIVYKKEVFNSKVNEI